MFFFFVLTRTNYQLSIIHYSKLQPLVRSGIPYGSGRGSGRGLVGYRLTVGTSSAAYQLLELLPASSLACPPAFSIACPPASSLACPTAFCLELLPAFSPALLPFLQHCFRPLARPCLYFVF